jgi:hypothetical protein
MFLVYINEGSIIRVQFGVHDKTRIKCLQTIVRFSFVNYAQLAMTEKSILVLQQLHLAGSPVS